MGGQPWEGFSKNDHWSLSWLILLTSSFWARDNKSIEICHTKLIIWESEVQEVIAIKLAPEMFQKQWSFLIHSQRKPICLLAAIYLSQLRNLAIIADFCSLLTGDVGPQNVKLENILTSQYSASFIGLITVFFAMIIMLKGILCLIQSMKFIRKRLRLLLVKVSFSMGLRQNSGQWQITMLGNHLLSCKNEMLYNTLQRVSFFKKQILTDY